MTMVDHRTVNNRRFLSAEGHATGSVEVCAAVSGIMFALAGWVKNNCQFMERGAEIKDGHMMVYAEKCPEVDAAFDMAVIGLLQIEQKYPEFIAVEEA